MGQQATDHDSDIEDTEPVQTHSLSKAVDFDGDTDAIDPDILDAVQRAFTNTIGYAIADAVHWRTDHDRDYDNWIGTFSTNFPETPAVSEDGTLEGWLPPYRAREDFEAELRETLPDGVGYERKNKHATILYEDTQ